MLLITHDKKFLEHLDSFGRNYYEVSKNEQQFSQIRRVRSGN